MNNRTVLAFYFRCQQYWHCKRYCLGYFRSLFYISCSVGHIRWVFSRWSMCIMAAILRSGRWKYFGRFFKIWKTEWTWESG